MIRDEPPQVIWLGVIAPVLLLLWAIWNLVVGKAYWPDRHGLVEFTDMASVACVIGMKTGAAVGAFGWFYLANHSRTQRSALPVTIAGFLLCGAAFSVLFMKLVKQAIS